VVDEVLLFHRGAGAVAFTRLIQEIRRRRYDYVLDFQGLARTGLLTLCAKAKKKIGRSDAREGSGMCYHHRVPLPPDGHKSHAVDILSEFLPALNLPRRVEHRLPLRIPQDSKACAPFKAPVLIFPESRRPEKNWPFYAELTTGLCRDRPDSHVLWAGGGVMACPEAGSLDNFVNLTAATTLPELIALLAQARLVVGNDSGPLHLAAAMGVPTLALFGPTDPNQFRPYPGDDRQNHVLRAPQGRLAELPARAVLNKIQGILA
jgi:heptosyltransferase I